MTMPQALTEIALQRALKAYSGKVGNGGNPYILQAS
jgi:hypothetical protein